MGKLLIFALVAILSLALAEKEWCDLESCGNREHVDCTMWDGTFAAACPDNAVMLNLESIINTILGEHNSFRNTIASGYLTDFFAATRMGTMQWNTVLANLARRNVKKCDFTEDECANTPDFDYVGQNIARTVYKTATNIRTNTEIIRGLLREWFAQFGDANMADIREFTNDPTIAKFSQTVRDSSTRVGCAALKYSVGADTTVLFTCNYDSDTVVGLPVYDDGPNRSKCTTGRNPSYPFLCSAREVYDVNKL